MVPARRIEPAPAKGGNASERSERRSRRCTAEGSAMCRPFPFSAPVLTSEKRNPTVQNPLAPLKPTANPKHAALRHATPVLT